MSQNTVEMQVKVRSIELHRELDDAYHSTGMSEEEYKQHLEEIAAWETKMLSEHVTIH